jgi:hypothetical protein
MLSPQSFPSRQWPDERHSSGTHSAGHNTDLLRFSGASSLITKLTCIQHNFP